MKNKTTLRSALHAMATACLAAFASSTAWAQASAPTALPDFPASAASTPGATLRTPPGPRLRSPAETGSRATTPGDLRPERPVTPQISVPLGKPQPVGAGETRPVRRQAAPAVGAVDNAVSRCESELDDRMRATCRARLAHESKVRPSN